MVRAPEWFARSRWVTGILLSCAWLLLGQEQCQRQDVDEDGFTTEEGDCDDQEPRSYPGAPELCDGLDNDCDSVVDDGVSQTFYPDRDNDGFGTSLGAESVCPAPRGYVPLSGDCNDAQGETYPGADELCDGVDNDCDGPVDEDPGLTYYPDSDEDGFGLLSGALVACEAPAGYVSRRGDCNDARADVFPAAPDEVGDGLDSDCGGSDAPQPSLGLSSTAFRGLQEALDAAVAGDTIWVGPGLYLERNLSFHGKKLTLISTDGPRDTTLNAQSQGRVFAFTDGEAGARLRGFTLTGGQADKGAGILVVGASPVLEELILANNRAELYGGGFHFDGGAPALLDSEILGNRCATNVGGGGSLVGWTNARLEGLRFRQNESKYQGGGLFAAPATLELKDSHFEDNRTLATYGGGMYAGVVAGSLVGVVFAANHADDGTWGTGGGLYLEKGNPRIEACEFLYNTASHAGGLYLADSSAYLLEDRIEGNTALDGAGMILVNATATLEDLKLANNTASLSGGGMYVDGGTPTFVGGEIRGNQALDGGGGYLEAADATFRDTLIAENRADNGGGGLVLNLSDPLLQRCVIRENRQDGKSVGGGGLQLLGSSPRIEDSLFEGNRSETYYTGGGGVYASGGAPTFVRTTFSRNRADSANGGALYLEGTGGSLTQCQAMGNRAGFFGGAAYLAGASTSITHSSLVANGVSYFNGGGLYLGGTGGRVKIRSSIIAFNTGGNLYRYSGSLELLYSLLYSGYGESHNLLSLDPSVLTVDPGFIAYSNDGQPENDVYNLAPGSPARDSGDPAVQDPDGSRSDMGAFSGPQASFSYYADQDGDTLYDGWERAHGLNTALNDASQDPDGDTLTNRQELEAHTYPEKADTDGDKDPDGLERAAGTSPVDFYAQIGVEGAATARVPQEFPTIQAAVNAVQWLGKINVASGVYYESLTIETKQASIIGLAGPTATVISGMGGSTVSVRQANLELSGFSLLLGEAVYGGGLYLLRSQATLSSLLISGNLAGDGGGLYATGSSFSLKQSVLEGNVATFGGGGLSVLSSDPEIQACVFVSNASSTGGGLYLSEASPVIQQSIIEGNTATEGGGIYVTVVSSRPSVVNSIFRGNQGYNLFQDDSLGLPVTEIMYSDLWAVPGNPNHNLPSLDPSNLTVEPAFLTYGPTGRPSDWHLSLTSPLVDAGDPLQVDVDGSPSDPGIYGTALGGTWDRDMDYYPDYFWPGIFQDFPEGVDVSAYDCSDTNSGTTVCE